MGPDRLPTTNPVGGCPHDFSGDSYSCAKKCQQYDSELVTPPINEVLREPGLQIIQGYNYRKKNKSVNYVSTRTLLDI